MKRMIDLFTSTFLLLLLLPIMTIISLLIRLTMGSPVLFIQRRPGLKGKYFHLYKFRTMSNSKDDQGNLLGDDQRLTAIGRFLRSFSLDEIPQLLNVFKGEMSLVGPRPLLVEYLRLYSKEQRKRHDVKPGITGWAQINGRNAITWEERFSLDVWYVENRSMILDFKILFLTFIKVIKRDGINNRADMIMEKFTGSNEVI